MFHQRSSISFGGDSASQNVNMMRRAHHQNENMIHRGKPLASSNNNNSNEYPVKGLSKTPHGKSTSTRRRAFGDISNKKSNFGSSSKQNSQQKEALKPRSNNNLLPRSKALQNNRFAILPEQKTFRNSVEQKSLFSATAQAQNHRSKKAEPLPDIERSAGRTWKQQLAYDLKDEDDLASVSSIESFLDLKNSSRAMWEQERNLSLKRQKEKDEEEDRQLRSSIQAAMDREQKEAELELDRLYGAIDKLELFSDYGDDSVGHDDLSGFGLGLDDDDDDLFLGL